jgi:hypothetical protein
MECAACKGFGRCRSCDGEGVHPTDYTETPDGLRLPNDCELCGASGKCKDCKGLGEVESPAD